jgi:hypothetical protein
MTVTEVVAHLQKGVWKKEDDGVRCGGAERSGEKG